MIQTFVFFDLETTGLIKGNKIPKITEISLVAVARSAISEHNQSSLPRVLHKLVLPVCPNEKIPTVVETLTSLSNENLRTALDFQHGVYELVVHFMQRLTVPICFVSHNGFAFDYPIFLWELKCVNKVLSQDILCIDTLHLFKDLFSKGNSSEQRDTLVNTVSSSTSHGNQDFHFLLNDGYDELLISALDTVMMENGKDKADVSNYSDSEVPAPQSTNSSNKCFTDPVHSNTSDMKSSPKLFHPMQKINEKTPENQIIKIDRTSGHTLLRCRKKLEFTERPPNFKLSTIYQHIVGKQPDQMHTAEGDCLSMLQCASHLGADFVEWADRNAVPLVHNTRKL